MRLLPLLPLFIAVGVQPVRGQQDPLPASPPDYSPARMLRHGVLTCESAGAATCELVLRRLNEPPPAATSGAGQ